MVRKQKPMPAPVATSEPEEIQQAEFSSQPPAPTKTVRVERIEEFEEPINASAPAPVTAPEPRPVALYEDDDDDEERNLKDFFDTLGTETSGFQIRVDRLINFRSTGQWGRQAPVEFCGQLNFDPANYLSQIQEAFGGGDYRVTLHRTNQYRFIRKWPVHIAETAADLAPVSPFAAPPSPRAAKPIDPIDGLIDNIERIERLKNSLFGKEKKTEPAPAPIAPNLTPIEKPLEERLIETVLNHAINTGDKGTINDVVRSYFRRDEPQESSLGSLIADLVKPLMPQLIPILGDELRKFSASTGGNRATVNVQSTPAPAPESAAAGALPFDELDNAWRRVVRRLIEDCAEDLPPESGAYAIVDLCDRFPDAKGIAQTLVTSSARTVLDYLIAYDPGARFLLSLPHSEEYVIKLQTELGNQFREEPEALDEGEPAPGENTAETINGN